MSVLKWPCILKESETSAGQAVAGSISSRASSGAELGTHCRHHTPLSCLWLANCRAILSSDWLMSLHQCPLRPWVTAPGPCCDPGHRGGWPDSPGPRVIGSWLLFHPSLPPFCCCLTRKYAFTTQLCRVSDSMQRTSNCESKTDILETKPNRKFLPLETD